MMMIKITIRLTMNIIMHHQDFSNLVNICDPREFQRLFLGTSETDEIRKVIFPFRM